MESLLKSATSHKRVDQKAFRSTFGYAKALELDHVLMVDMCQSFDYKPQVFLPKPKPCIIYAFDSNCGTIRWQRSFVDCRVRGFSKKIHLREIICGNLQLVERNP
jgi:hypothetical protein